MTCGQTDSAPTATASSKPPPATEADPANPLHNAFWRRDRAVVDEELRRVCARPLTFYPGFQFTGDLESVDTPGAWFVTRSSTVLEISRNPQIYSSSSGITINNFPPEFNEYFTSIITMDDPRHARLRKLVSAGFTPRMLARLEDSVQDQARLIVDNVCERGECDFVTAVRTAEGALSNRMDEVAESKVGVDTGDLTSVLVNAEVDGERLTRAELASFFILLVVAGNETTRNAISWGLVYLTDHPDQRRIWAGDFEGTANTAVEEIIRLASPVTYMRRTVLDDTMLEGRKIDEGDMVVMNYLCANRDESLFDAPYTFDVRRDPNPHLGFGGPGPHFCLGAHLARREIKVMFREIFNRIGDIRATGEPIPLSSAFIHGIKHLPAAFTPSKPVGARV